MLKCACPLPKRLAKGCFNASPTLCGWLRRLCLFGRAVKVGVTLRKNTSQHKAPKMFITFFGIFLFKTVIFFAGPSAKKNSILGFLLSQVENALKSPPLEGRVVVTWELPAGRKFFLGGFFFLRQPTMCHFERNISPSSADLKKSFLFLISFFPYSLLFLLHVVPVSNIHHFFI